MVRVVGWLPSRCWAVWREGKPPPHHHTAAPPRPAELFTTASPQLVELTYGAAHPREHLVGVHPYLDVVECKRHDGNGWAADHEEGRVSKLHVKLLRGGGGGVWGVGVGGGCGGLGAYYIYILLIFQAYKPTHAAAKDEPCMTVRTNASIFIC